MVDTPRTDAANLALLVIGGSAAISAQDLRDGYVSLQSKTGLSLRQYGAVGNGDGAGGGTNDAVAIQAAITAAAALGVILNGEGLIYRVDVQLTGASNLKLRHMTLDFSNSAATELFLFQGSEGGLIDVSGTLHKQNVTFSITSTTGLAAGDWLHITSDDFWSTTTTAGNVQSGELLRIKSVDTATDLTIYSHPHQDYRDTDNAAVRKQAYVENIGVEDVHIIGAGTSPSATAWAMEFCRNAHFVRCSVEDVSNRGWNFESSLHCSVRDCMATIHGGTAMYGIAAVHGCEHITVEGCEFYRCRHFFSVGGQRGICRHLNVRNNRVHGATNAGLDAHPSTDLCHYIDNYIEVEGSDGNNDGVLYQGSRFTCRGNQIVGDLARGIFLQGKVADVIDGADNWYVIEGNSIQGHAIEYGIDVVVDESRQVTGLTIAGNIISGPITNNGIRVQATAADIRGYSIRGNHIDFTSGATILIDANGATIAYGAIMGNTLIGNSGAPPADNINLSASAANLIRWLSITGNIIRYGTDGVEGTNEADICIVGNVFESITGAVDSLSTALKTVASNQT